MDWSWYQDRQQKQKKKLKKEKEGNVCQLWEGWGYTAEMKKKHIDARECTFRLHV